MDSMTTTERLVLITIHEHLREKYDERCAIMVDGKGTIMVGARDVHFSPTGDVRIRLAAGVKLVVDYYTMNYHLKQLRPLVFDLADPSLIGLVEAAVEKYLELAADGDQIGWSCARVI